MSILISVCHLHQDLLYLFVSCFHYTIHLGVIGNRILVFNLELLAKLLVHFPIQILSIICNELSWCIVMANDVLFQELGHHSLGNAFVGGSFHPLDEVVDGY